MAEGSRTAKEQSEKVERVSRSHCAVDSGPRRGVGERIAEGAYFHAKRDLLTLAQLLFTKQISATEQT